MPTLFRKEYPRRSRITELLFLILFIIIQKRISAKKSNNRTTVSHSVYRVDDTDIPANFCLGNRENN